MDINDLIKNKHKMLKKHQDKLKKTQQKNKEFGNQVKEQIEIKQNEFEKNKKKRASAFNFIRNK